MTLLGLAVNALLACIKLAAGLIGHSYALVADAAESLTDMFGSLVSFGGLVYAARPADREHPYGHGKAESIIAAFSALLICCVGAGIAYEAIHFIATPHQLPLAYTLVVLIAAVVVKELLFVAASRVGRQTGSRAVVADAWHHRSDAITSIAAAIGISVALVLGPGYEAADDWAALLGACVILFNGVRLFAGPLHELMDADAPEIAEQARLLAQTHRGIWGVEKVHARKSGLRYFIDMHIEVEPRMSVVDAHAIAHEIKDTIRGTLPNTEDVLIHIEPAPAAIAGVDDRSQRLLW